jgi:hypothetical protein
MEMAIAGEDQEALVVVRGAAPLEDRGDRPVQVAAEVRPSTSRKPYSFASVEDAQTLPAFARTFGSAASAATARPT